MSRNVDGKVSAWLLILSRGLDIPSFAKASAKNLVECAAERLTQLSNPGSQDDFEMVPATAEVSTHCKRHNRSVYAISY